MINRLSKMWRYTRLVIKRYKYREKEVVLYRERCQMSWFVLIVTLIIILSAIGIYLWLIKESSGTYLAGWFAFSSIAVLALIALSAPFSVVITNRNIKLHGYIDIYQIPISSVISIEEVKRKEYCHYIPVMASLGYFGYFGYFLNWKDMELCKVYTTKYSKWIKIKTNNKTSYIINVKAPEEFLEKYRNIVANLPKY